MTTNAPMWRTDATIGTVLGMAGRMTPAQRGDRASVKPGKRVEPA
jgi:hypothetical protein